MAVHDVSATPLDAVTVEERGPFSDVWLRKGITETEIETDGLPQTMWEADVVYGTLPGTPTVAEVAARFSLLWREFEDAALTPAQRAEARMAGIDDALADLAEVASAEATDMAMVMDAIAELSEVVSSMAGGE